MSQILKVRPGETEGEETNSTVSEVRGNNCLIGEWKHSKDFQAYNK